MEENKIFMPPPPKELKQMPTPPNELKKSQFNENQVESVEKQQVQVNENDKSQNSTSIKEDEILEEDLKQDIVFPKKEVIVQKHSSSKNWKSLLYWGGFILSLGAISVLIYLLVK